MDPLSLLSSIWSAKSKLQQFVATVKANPKQCNTLKERVEAMTPGLQRLEAQQKAHAATGAASSSAGSKPSPSDLTLQRHLATLLSAVEDSVALVSKFSSASCLSRLWKKSDYSSDFASLHAALSQAQADLGFGLQVDQLFSAARDAEDSKADLADIGRKQELILSLLDQLEAGLEAGFEAQAVGQAQLHNEQQAFMLHDLHRWRIS